MNTLRTKVQLFLETNIQVLLFVLTSVIGLLIGIIFSVHFPHSAYGIEVFDLCVTPVYPLLLAANVIPIGVLVFCLAFSLTSLCYPLILLHSVCRGFIGMFFYLSIGDGAWLMRLSLLFSSYTAAILMWWLLFRNVNQPGKSLSKDACLSFVVICLITVIDLKAIAPFLSRIFVQ